MGGVMSRPADARRAAPAQGGAAMPGPQHAQLVQQAQLLAAAQQPAPAPQVGQRRPHEAEADDDAQERRVRTRSQGPAEHPDGMPDAHPARHGDMIGFRAVAPDERFEPLMAQARQGGAPLPAPGQVGPPMNVPLAPRLVAANIPQRTSAYVTTFNNATGHRGAADHATAVGLGIDNVNFEILHAQGHGQVGANADHDPDNLSAATHGANSQMIPYDDAVSGNTNVQVGSFHRNFTGTRVAESTQQQFFHPAYANGQQPFFAQSIAGDRSPVTVEEYREHQARAQNLRAYVAQLDAAHAGGGQHGESFDEMEFRQAREAREEAERAGSI